MEFLLTMQLLLLAFLQVQLIYVIYCFVGKAITMDNVKLESFIKCGKKGCRRCKLHGVFVPASNHYYYPGFRLQGRFPWENKSILDSIEILKEIEEEERITVKQEKSKNTGYTGLSIFHRLYPLYQFIYDKDFVYDEMHGIPLNVVKRQIQCLLESGDEDLNWQVVDERLQTFPWTHEHRTGRLPSGITKRFGYWKAEDFNHFAFPAMESCLGGMLQNNTETREILCCLARIVEFLGNHARNGRSQADAFTFHEMCVRYAVLVEESSGVENCVITLHNLLHFKGDIARFSSLDNYSCWTEERAVRRYILASNNHKNIEITFALSEARREFLKLRELNQHEDVLNPPAVCQADISKASARSLQFAKKLLENSKETDYYERLSVGILVGGLKTLELSDRDCQTISIACSVPDDSVACIGWCSRSLWKPKHSFEGLLYRVGEHVIFADPDEGDTVAILEIGSLFSVKIDDVPVLFCKGKRFEYDGATDLGLKVVSPTDTTVLFKASVLSRKVMLCARNDDDDDDDERQCFILVDYMRRVFPVTEGTVVVPYYPVVNDMIKIKGDDGQVWKARVLSFNLTHLTVNAKFFIEDHIEG